MMKVKDLIKFLQKQNPEAYLFAYDTYDMDYKKISKSIFKNVKNAKAEERRKLRKLFKDLTEKEINEQIEREMLNNFKFCEDDDVLIGLKK